MDNSENLFLFQTLDILLDQIMLLETLLNIRKNVHPYGKEHAWHLLPILYLNFSQYLF